MLLRAPSPQPATLGSAAPQAGSAQAETGVSAPPAPVPVGDWPPGVALAVDGHTAFAHLLAALEAARHHVRLRAYIWRDDLTGQAVAEALLRAAERGVQIHIQKDLDGATHEVHEASGQSLWHKHLSLGAHVRATALYGFYGPRPKLARQRPGRWAEALRAHPNVHVDIGHHFDHAKVFEVDGAHLLLGGMCLGDDAHFELLDYLWVLDGAEYVARYEAREAGAPVADFPPAVQFWLNGPHQPAGALRARRLALIEGAKHSVRVEMAFFGDRAFTDALVAAVDRGVAVSVLTSSRAGKLRWYNPRLLEHIRKRTGNPEHLRLALHPRVVHAKLLVVDELWVDLGSANFTRLSHEGYREANLCVRSYDLARALVVVMEQHLAEAQRARRRIRASLLKAGLEAHFMSRAGKAAMRHWAPAAPKARLFRRKPPKK